MGKDKTFNVTGVCIPDKHYMADIGERLEKISLVLSRRKMAGLPYQIVFLRQDFIICFYLRIC